MPISLTCQCGQSLQVEDQYAGQQVQCPTCKAILTAPATKPTLARRATAIPLAPPPKPKTSKSIVAEDAGFEVVEDEPKSKRPSRRFEEDEDNDEERPARRRRRDEDDDDRPRRKRRKAKSTSSSARMGAIIGGIVMILLGIGLFVVLWSLNVRRIPFLGILLTIFGIISLYNGVTGSVDEDDE